MIQPTSVQYSGSTAILTTYGFLFGVSGDYYGQHALAKVETDLGTEIKLAQVGMFQTEAGPRYVKKVLGITGAVEWAHSPVWSIPGDYDHTKIRAGKHFLLLKTSGYGTYYISEPTPVNATDFGTESALRNGVKMSLNAPYGGIHMSEEPYEFTTKEEIFGTRPYSGGPMESVMMGISGFTAQYKQVPATPGEYTAEGLYVCLIPTGQARQGIEPITDIQIFGKAPTGATSIHLSPYTGDVSKATLQGSILATTQNIQADRLFWHKQEDVNLTGVIDRTTYYIYSNGIRTPNMPAVDTKTYPYIVMLGNYLSEEDTDWQAVHLVCSSKPFVYDPSTGKCTTEATGHYLYMLSAENKEEWQDLGVVNVSPTPSYGWDGNVYQRMWSNRQISDAENNVYLAQIEQEPEEEICAVVWCEAPAGGQFFAQAVLHYTCLSGDTLITMADGTSRRLDTLCVGDQVLSIDNKPTHIHKVERGNYNGYHTLYYFDDGTVVDETHEHRFFNIEKQTLVKLRDWTIGEHAQRVDGSTTSLKAVERIDVPAEMFGIYTDSGYYWANGLLTGEATAAARERLSGDKLAKFVGSIPHDKLNYLIGELGWFE